MFIFFNNVDFNQRNFIENVSKLDGSSQDCKILLFEINTYFVDQKKAR